VSDSPASSDWWLASNGRWYPSHLHPSAGQAGGTPFPSADPWAAPPPPGPPKSSTPESAQTALDGSWAPPPGPPPSGAAPAFGPWPVPPTPPETPWTWSGIPPRRSRARNVAVLLAMILAIGIGITLGATLTTGDSSASGPVTARSSLAADRGRLVYSDDFRDPASGWTQQTLPSGTSFGYGAGGYVIEARESLHHIAYAPFTEPIPEESVAITARQSGGTAGAGYGAVCTRGTGDSEVHYEFLVVDGSGWFLERGQGAVNASTSPDLIAEGAAPAEPGISSMTVEGTCATLSDGITTRLALFVNGTKVVDTTDQVPSLPQTGWTSGLVVASSADSPSIVTVTGFQVRNAAG
jgi:hypothetical protein